MNLEANNISFSYTKKRKILNDISLSLKNNEILGLIGDSGSGKSTLCKILSGHISNYSGKGFLSSTINFPTPGKNHEP